MKFLADEMLGRLAKWLRILGYDTIYTKGVKDSTLVRMAISDKRILLTRDTSLVRQKGLRDYVLIKHDHLMDQLRQVIEELRLSYPENSFSRCTICNTTLTPFSKEDACKTVPPYVCMTQEIFGKCPECRRIYWKGTHYGRMKRNIDRIFERHNQEY